MQSLITFPSPVPDQEAMALRKEHTDFIRDEIKTQLALTIDGSKPHGWRKAAFVLRELGPLIGTIAVFFTLLAITLGALYQSWGHVKEEATFRQHTEDRLKSIEESLFALRTAQAAASPTDPRDIQEVKLILVQAKAANITMPSSVIEKAGGEFIGASREHPDAWGAALAFVDYRTFLNTDLTPVLSKPTKVMPNIKVGNYMFELNLKPRPGTEHKDVVAVSVTTSGTPTSPEESARLELLSAPQPRGSGVAQIVITGRTDELLLDGQFLKNVTVVDADVSYGGGSLRLTNVVFINCRFHFVNQQPSRDLGQSILRAATVNFSQNVG